MSLLGYVLLLSAALCCTAAPASTDVCPIPPRLDEAELQGDWEEESYPQGRQATYHCRPGFSRLGTIKMTCKAGSWKYELPKGQCRKKSCGHPGDIPFGSFQLTKGDLFVFGAVVEYHCDDGYQMVSKETKRQCTASGWSNFPPHCEVRNCPPVEAAENMNVLSTSYDEEYSVGQVVKFECKNPNFKLDGPSEIFCTSEGDWNLKSPSCIEITCKAPVIHNGEVINSKKNGYKNNEVIQFTCKEGFTASTSREITCGKDDWNPKPACNEIVCNPYYPVEKGRLIGTRAEYRYGDEIDVECEEDFMLQQEPNKRRKCTSNGWYPPIRCVSKKCDRPDIKNAYIQYDYYYPKDIGRYLDYRCEGNFLSPGKEYWTRIYCTKDGWNPEPKCLRQCAYKKASFENADIMHPYYNYKYLEGEKVKFRCKQYYQTPDGKTDGERTCLPDGEFTPAKCSRTCPAPELPNGIFKPRKSEFEIGEYLQYECKTGYMTASRNLKGGAQCRDRGWSEPPSCIPITCEYKGVQYGYENVIEYTCPEGKRPKSATGQCYYYGWGPPPSCQDIKCPIPDTSDLILSPHRSSYKTGDEVSFSCKEGFTRDGSLESVCTNEGWNPSLPTCQKISNIQCFIADKHNLIRKPLKVKYVGNDEVSVSCEEGFTQKGPSKTTCTENDWNPPLPTCEEKNTDQAETTGPPPDKKEVEFIKPDSVLPPPDSEDNKDEISAKPDSTVPPLDGEENKEQREKCPPAYSPKNLEILDPKEAYYSNDTVTMKCENGYKMNGSPTVHCIKGKWEQPPECIQLIPCSKPREIKNGDIIESFMRQTYVTDDVVKYQCKSGYHISGSDEITCINGQWPALPTCTEDSCDATPEVTHATVLEEKEVYNHGEKAKYVCKNGFRLSGEDPICLRGEWNNVPACVETSCKRPPSVENGRINGEVRASYASGEKITYSCDAGYSLERSWTGEAVCNNAEWTEVQVCRKIGERCGPPPLVQFGDTVKFSQSSYKSGDSVEYKCPEYYVLKGSKTVRCFHGVWEEAPVCLEPCTAKEKDMEENNIQLRWKIADKLYSQHGDHITFMCKSGYEAPPDTQMTFFCEQGKLEYPKCFKRGFCMLEQQTMITNNIHYNVSTVVDHGQTITFQCNEGMIPEKNLEAKCTWRKIAYPKCIAAKSCNTPEIPNGSLRNERQASYESGSYVDFQCNEDYVINNPIDVKCENGKWTDLPVCLSPCKISTEDLTKSNIQLLPSADPKNILESNHRHGTEISVTCKSGFRRPNPADLKIECNDGKVTYPRCLSGETCRIDQEGLDENNLELDEVHNNERYYQKSEIIQFKCKNGFYHRSKPTGTCSGTTLTYPKCTAKSSSG